jgi:hypothetical protein
MCRSLLGHAALLIGRYKPAEVRSGDKQWKRPSSASRK